MKLGDHLLKVQKASIGITQVAGVEMGVNAMSMLAGTTSTDSELSRVLQLLNMVTPDELMDNDDYEGKSARNFPPSCMYLMQQGRGLISLQKSKRTFRRSARSSAQSWGSRSRDRSAAAGSRLAWARFLSSLIRPRLPRRL